MRPGRVDAVEQIEEADASAAGTGREICAGNERTFVGVHEDRQGPAAVTGHGLADVHVDTVDVRTFFAIDLDADEVFVEEGRNVWVDEGLMFHDVTPMARGVADGDKDGFVFGAGEVEGFHSPRPPCHGIMGMLQEVGTLLVDEQVRCAVIRHKRC